MRLRLSNADGDTYDSDRPVHLTGQGPYSRALLPKDILPSPPATTPSAPIIGQPFVAVALCSFMAGIVACLLGIAILVRFSR